MSLTRPDRWNASGVMRISSGQPYTPTVSSGFTGGLENNSGRKPTSLDLDLRCERQILFAGRPASLFGRVFNTLDARFFNGFVFGSTGSPFYSSDLVTDKTQLADPTRYYGPRRLEAGITVRRGGGE